MADNSRFSNNFMSVISITPLSGESIIAISRAILRNDYSDDEYKKDFFSIFILIDEETGSIVLDKFGEFNISSPRHALTSNFIKNTIRAMSSTGSNSEPIPNSDLHRDEINEIAHLYRERFINSLSAFKDFFGILPQTPPPP